MLADMYQEKQDRRTVYELVEEDHVRFSMNIKYPSGNTKRKIISEASGHINIFSKCMIELYINQKLAEKNECPGSTVPRRTYNYGKRPNINRIERRLEREGMMQDENKLSSEAVSFVESLLEKIYINSKEKIYKPSDEDGLLGDAFSFMDSIYDEVSFSNDLSKDYRSNGYNVRFIEDNGVLMYNVVPALYYSIRALSDQIGHDELPFEDELSKIDLSKSYRCGLIKSGFLKETYEDMPAKNGNRKRKRCINISMKGLEFLKAELLPAIDRSLDERGFGTIPYEDNALLLYDIYREMSGSITKDSQS